MSDSGASQPTAEKLQWLEAMRGGAACWVLFHHAHQAVSHFIGPLGRESIVLANGYLGVDFFFVLSGFIIALSTNRLLAKGGTWRDYALARAIRIYVPYWPIGVGIWVLYSLFPGFSASNRELGVLTTLTLLPSSKAPALSVAWTLVHEVLFYILFSLVFVSRRALHLGLVIWGITIVGTWYLAVQLDGSLMIFLSPYNLCFLLGVALHVASRRSTNWSCLGIGVVVILSTTLIFSQVGRDSPNRVATALGFAGLVLASCAPQAQRRSPGAWLLTLGAASYSIYLVHNPFLSIAVRIARGLSFLGTYGSYFLISIASLVAELSYYWSYERRVISMTKGWLLEAARDLATRKVIKS